jgi:hypothetical protein
LPQTLDELFDAEAGEGNSQDECTEQLKHTSSFTLSLRETGLVFSNNLERANGPCGSDIEVPFAKLKPFLSPAGKKAVAELMKTAGKEQKAK